MRFRAGVDGLTVTLPSGEVISCPPGSVIEGVLRSDDAPEASSNRKRRQPHADKMRRDYEDKSDESEIGRH